MSTTFTWTGKAPITKNNITSYYWSDPNNWSNNQIPTNGSDIVFNVYNGIVNVIYDVNDYYYNSLTANNDSLITISAPATNTNNAFPLPASISCFDLWFDIIVSTNSNQVTINSSDAVFFNQGLVGANTITVNCGSLTINSQLSFQFDGSIILPDVVNLTPTSGLANLTIQLNNTTSSIGMISVGMNNDFGLYGTGILNLSQLINNGYLNLLGPNLGIENSFFMGSTAYLNIETGIMNSPPFIVMNKSSTIQLGGKLQIETAGPENFIQVFSYDEESVIVKGIINYIDVSIASSGTQNLSNDVTLSILNPTTNVS